MEHAENTSTKQNFICKSEAVPFTSYILRNKIINTSFIGQKQAFTLVIKFSPRLRQYIVETYFTKKEDIMLYILCDRHNISIFHEHIYCDAWEVLCNVSYVIVVKLLKISYHQFDDFFYTCSDRLFTKPKLIQLTESILLHSENLQKKKSC